MNRNAWVVVCSLPNLISLSRLIGCIFVPFFLEAHQSFYAFLVFVYLGISDWFDGFLARKLGQESMIGKILDPLADKICIGVILVYFVFKGFWPCWVVSTIIGRDLAQVLFAGVFLKNGLVFKKIQGQNLTNSSWINPSWISKTNTFFIFFTIGMFLIKEQFFMFYLSQPSFLIIACLTIWSSIDYMSKVIILYRK